MIAYSESLKCQAHRNPLRIGQELLENSNVFRTNGHNSEPILKNYGAKSTLVSLTDSISLSVKLETTMAIPQNFTID